MDADGRYHDLGNFSLESGRTIKDAKVCYKTFGELNQAGDNCVVVCHALTGNASVDQWWEPLLGPKKLFDTDKYMVFCANILGSCYGSSGPADVNPETNERYGMDFPLVTIRDTVRSHKTVLDSLGVNKIKFVLGGSLGGMQALEWGIMGGPDLVESMVIIACGARHTAWQIAISEVQRNSIMRDPTWDNGRGKALSGLGLARQLAMISYRSHDAYDKKFGRNLAKGEPDDVERAIQQAVVPRFDVEGYLAYQDKKFLSRFDSASYVRCTQKMDTHDVARGRGSVEEVLGNVKQPSLVIGFDGDLLYPLSEQRELAELLPNSELKEICSDAGHDAFLLEYEAIQSACDSFLTRLD
ncbi:hypothetical protein AAMO2058_000287600 [Amorphochlora amoebiformis]